MRNGETHGALGCLFREDHVGLVRGREGTMLGSRGGQRKSGMNAERLSAIIHKRDVWDKKMHLWLYPNELSIGKNSTYWGVHHIEDTMRVWVQMVVLGLY